MQSYGGMDTYRPAIEKRYPLSFREFLMATGKERFADLLDSQDYKMVKNFNQTYIDALKQYYFICGMLESTQDSREVCKIKKQILTAYEQDFSKHAPNEIVPKSECSGMHSFPSVKGKQKIHLWTRA